MGFYMYSKDEVRKRVWDSMAEMGVARFPLPPHGRIPNFVGAELTALSIRDLDIYRGANTIKVSPDSPQRAIRELVLKDGKTLLMPTPRIREGFLMLTGRKVYGKYREASTIRGAFKYGRRIDIQMIPEIDLIITGSVAVSVVGDRIGKGEGYGEIEYALLRELDKVGEDTPIISNVHDVQVFESLPKDVFDLTLDIIVTPTRVIRVEGRGPRPKCIYWDRLSKDKIDSIPILRELWTRRREQT